MARRRRQHVPGSVAARDALARQLRASAALVYSAAQAAMGAGEDPAGWLDQADALDAGEPVVLPGYALARWVEGPRPAEVPGFRVEPDGVLTPMRRVHRGDRVEWEPWALPGAWRLTERPNG